MVLQLLHPPYSYPMACMHSKYLFETGRQMCKIGSFGFDIQAGTESTCDDGKLFLCSIVFLSSFSMSSLVCLCCCVSPRMTGKPREEYSLNISPLGASTDSSVSLQA